MNLDASLSKTKSFANDPGSPRLMKFQDKRWLISARIDKSSKISGVDSHTEFNKNPTSACVFSPITTHPRKAFHKRYAPRKLELLPQVTSYRSSEHGMRHSSPCGSGNGLILDSEFAASYRCCCGCRIAVRLRSVLMEICPCKTFVQGEHSVFVFQPHQGLHPGESNRWSSFPQPCPDNVGIPFFGHRCGFVFFS
jgi:hypothetical protein